ncbi:uncharacterized protein LOC111088788 [Limulus polyphemus]|uniref:Uncharacterized protein LOC111088788 n=1 Tax=Limulus polyphemus TaxID=6850 RepID=A0ABM1THW9_LIMPO|nr:uncharacterized protein LOC111088788 [Limulus polyphemus]
MIILNTNDTEKVVPRAAGDLKHSSYKEYLEACEPLTTRSPRLWYQKILSPSLQCVFIGEVGHKTMAFTLRIRALLRNSKTKIKQQRRRRETTEIKRRNGKRRKTAGYDPLTRLHNRLLVDSWYLEHSVAVTSLSRDVTFLAPPESGET